MDSLMNLPAVDAAPSDPALDPALILRLSDAFGPPGFEEAVTDVVRNYLPAIDTTLDAMNNLYLRHPGNTGRRPVIQLDAHLDEVGFMVHSIRANGTIALAPLGGWVPSSVPSQPFLIRNRKGELIRGIIVSKPPHFKTAREKADERVSLEDVVLDVGAVDRTTVTDVLGIAPGDPVAPEVTGSFNPKTGILFGKAFDNRLGCMAVMEVMKRLAGEELPVDLVGALAAQEEVGMRGAQVTSQVVRPDYAIVFEGSPADDLYFDEYTRQGALKGGVQIRHLDASYISHPGFIHWAEETARTQSIKTQHTVRRSGSTNAGRISLTGKAVPCLVLGIPSRFIHTHYNYAALEDLEAAVRLTVALIRNFKEDLFIHE